MTVPPTSISASRSKGLLMIDWEDGHHSEYKLAGLRAACPCAECRGGHEGMGKKGTPEMLAIPLSATGSTELERMEGVGNYALQLVWSDGHAYGIFTWDYLRELCPCGEEH